MEGFRFIVTVKATRMRPMKQTPPNDTDDQLSVITTFEDA